MSDKAIVNVEVPHTAVIHCPFCGQEVVDPAKAREGQDYFAPCPHTLFVAHDHGFEYRSDRLDAALGIAGVENEDINLPEHGFDGLTNQVKLDGAVKFASFTPPPSFEGSYVGFMPED